MKVAAWGDRSRPSRLVTVFGSPVSWSSAEAPVHENEQERTQRRRVGARRSRRFCWRSGYTAVVRKLSRSGRYCWCRHQISEFGACMMYSMFVVLCGGRRYLEVTGSSHITRPGKEFHPNRPETRVPVYQAVTIEGNRSPAFAMAFKMRPVSIRYN